MLGLWIGGGGWRMDFHKEVCIYWECGILASILFPGGSEVT